ncbi:MAG TPA: excinuclease ABC subunit UvrB [Candidatus Paceibacterota bacterium]
MKFKLTSEYKPSGDQPQAIGKLVEGINSGTKEQTLLGVTGSGKTFTVANVIQELQMPTLVIAHNKTLAAQLAQEFKEFFPENEVHYFVSYYDYYQPEAYISVTDTYIEKDAQINEEIDRLRHASTQSLLTRNDVIIVASVSCIYGLGSPEEYKEQYRTIKVGDTVSRTDLLTYLIRVHYERTNVDLKPGHFRAIGAKLEIMPMSEKIIYAITWIGSKIAEVLVIDPVSSSIVRVPDEIVIFPAKHHLVAEDERNRALKAIEEEMTLRVQELLDEGKLLEAERLKRRTTYDMAMIREFGFCQGIENYSRHLSGKLPGEAPETLISYFPRDKNGKPKFLTVIDESHVTIPQVRGMYAGDRSRKESLVEHGFRLPSALDNRPLRFEEFEKTIGQRIYVSATPGPFEREHSSYIAEQLIRPTGLLDPLLEVRPIDETATYKGQVHDFIDEAVREIEKGNRVLATTLTKKMAEDLALYLKDRGMKAEYLHSDIETIERIEILSRLRRGEFDCLVGVNLLREGLDLPEVTLIGILDADKEGFLRSETALIQVIGRAARNSEGRVLLYANHITGSMERAIFETRRRRGLQEAYNTEHGITPTTIKKSIKDITDKLKSERDKALARELEEDVKVYGGDMEELVTFKTSQMEEAVEQLDFETAAMIRDEINLIRAKMAGADITQLTKKLGRSKKNADAITGEKKPKKIKGMR